jgi:hypothetical protein
MCGILNYQGPRATCCSGVTQAEVKDSRRVSKSTSESPFCSHLFLQGYVMLTCSWSMDCQEQHSPVNHTLLTHDRPSRIISALMNITRATRVSSKKTVDFVGKLSWCWL